MAHTCSNIQNYAILYFQTIVASNILCKHFVVWIYCCRFANYRILVKTLNYGNKEINERRSSEKISSFFRKKKAFVAELEKSMRDEYRKETGKEAKSFSVL